jgi:hypothetical protein
MEEPGIPPVAEGPLYSMVLTTQAIHCTPYEGWEDLETPGGERVSGLEVCAEFEDACWCETRETTHFGTALVTSGSETEEGCFRWKLVESGFWAYPEGLVCPEKGDWSLDIEAYPDSTCAISLPPLVEWTQLVRMEVVCEWTTDEGTVLVADRLLIQILS